MCCFCELKVTSLLRPWWTSWGIKTVDSTWRACSWQPEAWCRSYPGILLCQGFTILQRLRTRTGTAASQLPTYFWYQQLISKLFLMQQVCVQTFHLCEKPKAAEGDDLSQLRSWRSREEETTLPEQTWPQAPAVCQTRAGGCRHRVPQGSLIHFCKCEREI